MEHISKLMAQYRDVNNDGMMKWRIFPLSLLKTASTWYTGLPANSVQNWEDMESKFHTQFYRVVPKVTLLDLATVKQYNNEMVD